MIQGIPAFRDFTIPDTRYYLILFWASFYGFEEKTPIFFFFWIFLNFFLDLKKKSYL